MLNFVAGYILKDSLTGKNYVVTVEIDYDTESNLELLYDAGSDFDFTRRKSQRLNAGKQRVQLPFTLNKGEHLRALRLDFGADPTLKKVALNSLTLATEDHVLFKLDKKQIPKSISFTSDIEKIDPDTATFSISNAKASFFDPYIVFDPVNQLIQPKWIRVLLLLTPWLALFFLPCINWLQQIGKEKKYALIFLALFMAAVPLKIAWVTFTTLLILTYALLQYFRKKRIYIGLNHIVLLIFFAVPAIFLGNGNIEKLAIPLGFVLFAIIGVLMEFSKLRDQIKKIYTTIFFVFMSILIVSWIILMAYYGYYYKLDMVTYLADVKNHAYATLFWTQYKHSTFLSFFIIVGGIFCLDLFKKKAISLFFGLTYAVLAIFSLVLLGSRFALLMFGIVLILYHVPIKNLGKVLFGVWILVVGGILLLVKNFDAQRLELWETTWKAIKNNLWFGHGTGTSSTALPEYVMIKKAGIETMLEVNHSHNQFLTYWLENGLLGLFLFFVAFLYLGIRLAKLGDRTMLLVSFMILSLCIIESPFRTATPLYMIAFLIAVFPFGKKERQQLKY